MSSGTTVRAVAGECRGPRRGPPAASCPIHGPCTLPSRAPGRRPPRHGPARRTAGRPVPHRQLPSQALVCPLHVQDPAGERQPSESVTMQRFLPAAVPRACRVADPGRACGNQRLRRQLAVGPYDQPSDELARAGGGPSTLRPARQRAMSMNRAARCWWPTAEGPLHSRRRPRTACRCSCGLCSDVGALRAAFRTGERGYVFPDPVPGLPGPCTSGWPMSVLSRSSASSWRWLSGRTGRSGIARRSPARSRPACWPASATPDTGRGGSPPATRRPRWPRTRGCAIVYDIYPARAGWGLPSATVCGKGPGRGGGDRSPRGTRSGGSRTGIPIRRASCAAQTRS